MGLIRIIILLLSLFGGQNDGFFEGKTNDYDDYREAGIRGSWGTTIDRRIGEPNPNPIRDTGTTERSVDLYTNSAFADYICTLQWDCAYAQRVIHCESKDNPLSDNGSDRGLFQLNQIHAIKWPDYWQNWSDPYWNINHAYELYVEWGGWKPWWPSSGCSGVR